ncbi:MAG: hypothetical protein SNJ81_16630 [Cyanobacteriota bacterium]
MVTLFAHPREIALETGGFHAEIAAAAQNLDGFTVREDYMAVIGEYIRKKLILWPLLPKEPAESDLVREILEGPEPNAGFFNKTSMNPPENATNSPIPNDLSDTGQQVKAVGGVINIGHYSRSLWAQQGRPYGTNVDQLTAKTERLLSSTAKILERTIVTGNATENPLEFNGFQQQMAAGQTRMADITDGDSVVKKLRSVVRLAISNENILQGITHIICSPLGLQLIEEEIDTKLDYVNLDEVTPGLRVPGIITQGDQQGRPTPIITSPYILDEDGGTNPDIVDFWLVDMNQLVWKGVRPAGGATSGADSFNPQVFELTNTAAPYLVEKRICIAYGTLYAKNRGRGIWRLRVTVPTGTVGSI